LCSQPVNGTDLQDQSRWASEESARRSGAQRLRAFSAFQPSTGYNEINPGVGLRYAFWRPAPRWEVFGDTSIYYDSRRHWAKYVAVGASYRLSESWAVGAAVAYGQSETYQHGKPFFAPVPGLAFVHRGVAFNAVLLPSESSNAKIQGLAFFVTIPLGRHD
jgi:hypothetical protein